MTPNHKPRLPRPTLAIAAFAVLAAACGGAADSATAPTATTATPLATTTTTTTQPATTLPTTTAAPTTTVEPEPKLLLAYGDSFASLYGWPSMYGEMAGDTLGGVVEVGGLSCSICKSILSVIKGAKQRELIGEATIIVLQPYPGRVFAAPFSSFLNETCGGEDGQECISDALAEFDIYVADLLDNVTDLANPDAVIRVVPTGTWALDHFYPNLRTQDPASFDIMLTALIEFADRIDAAAAARCIGVTDASALLSGPNYRDPIDPSHTHDGAHPSKEASRLIAADLHALGYTPTRETC